MAGTARIHVAVWLEPAPWRWPGDGPGQAAQAVGPADAGVALQGGQQVRPQLQADRSLAERPDLSLAISAFLVFSQRQS